ncbi:MAG: 4-(cytidine 5'-diphospho)-2-C-methyl-D-erythritol kinase [Planctomycetota bacterium]
MIAARNYLRKTTTGLLVQAPAKLNLYLDVQGRRPDGFHDLETLIVPINLFDSLYIAPNDARGSAITLRVHDLRPRENRLSGIDEPIPTDGRNLVVRALEKLREAIGIDRGAKVELWKRIPSRAGLGGGSSDAAAALVAGLRLWNKRLPQAAIDEIAAALGSDVPAMLRYGPSVCRGRGEVVEAVRLPARAACVLVQPPVGLGAGEVFSQFTPQDRGVHQQNQREYLMAALRRGNLAEAGKHLRNDLQEAASRFTPWVDRLRKTMERLPVAGHQMSGSGSVYFALCGSLRLARRVASELRQHRLGWVGVAATL